MSDNDIPDVPTDGFIPIEELGEIPTYTTYNPLCDFISIGPHTYAIISSVAFATVTRTNKKGDKETTSVLVYRTRWINEKGEQGTVRISAEGYPEDKIDGNPAVPLFTADEFETATESYKGILKHTYTTKNIGKVQELKQILHWTENAIKSILTVSEGDLKLFACWIIASHFHRVFSQFPPLIFSKPGYSAGGSVALTASALAPYPVTIFEPTEATLFRLSQMGFTLLIDELDPEQRQSIRSLNLILDGSFSKDSGIPRASGKGFAVEGFLPYGPKVVVDPQTAIVKAATASRAVRIVLREDRNRSETVNTGEFVNKYRYLIDYLYEAYIPYAHAVRKTYDDVTEFKGRQKQAYGPIMAIAKLTGCAETVYNALKTSIGNAKIQRSEDPTKYVLNTVYDFFLEYRNYIDLYFSSDKKGGSYIQLTELRKIIIERTMESHQADESENYDNQGNAHINKRQWKKLPDDVKLFFTAQHFNAIINDALGQWVKPVRGDRLGIKVTKLDVKGVEPLDPLLDELEKILGITNSYKDIKDKEEPRGKESTGSKSNETVKNSGGHDEDVDIGLP